MNLFFLGTPDFAVPSLVKAAGLQGHKISGVITAPDKPAGRSLKLTPPPVKTAALELGIPVHQPEKFNTEENLKLVTDSGADLLVVVAYGKIIGDRFLNAFKDRIINVHPSLLPKYRGVAPYQWALVNGETETGVSIIYITKELDAGDIILQNNYKIKDSDNASTLHDVLAETGAELLCEAIVKIAGGSAVRIPQNHSEATYYKKIEKSMGHIDWKNGAKKISDLVRGLYSWPSTFVNHGGNLIKIHEVEAISAEHSAASGEIIEVSEEYGVTVAAGNGAVVLKRLQLASKSAQNYDTFLRGYKMKKGDILN